MNEIPVITGEIFWSPNYQKHKQLLSQLQYPIVSSNPWLRSQMFIMSTKNHPFCGTLLVALMWIQAQNDYSLLKTSNWWAYLLVHLTKKDMAKREF